MSASLVFPARAGMIPKPKKGNNMTERIPRESGDDPAPAPRGHGKNSYSPRERG